VYVKYGTFQHAANEANLVSMTQRLLYSNRGEVRTTRKTLSIQAVLIASTQATIKTAIANVESAYGSNGGDFGLYHDDNTVSTHFLDSSASISGTRVVAVNFQQGHGAEYATQRTVSVTVEADFANTAISLLSWQETLRFSGNAGLRFVFLPVLNGVPQKQIVNQRTTMNIVQAGSAVGHLSYPDYPSPIFPSAEHVDRRDRTVGPPRWNGNSFTDWPISWVHHFESAQAESGTPNRR